MICSERKTPLVLLGFLWLLCACAQDVQGPALNTDVSPEDLMIFDTGKADGNIFNPERLIEDHIFVDTHFMSASDVKAFLEWTPYNKTSFLAYHTDDGMTAAEMIVKAAQDYSINPLILLVKLQVESSLIAKTQPPSTYVLERSMGCGCQDDNPGCHGAPKGLYEQLVCASSLFRKYMDNLESSGETWTGWGVGIAKKTSEDQWITPENHSTAALYTYTPWVLEGQGGNWLFWNVYRKYAHFILKTRPNHRWIGGPCESNETCAYEGGLCDTSFVQEDPVTGTFSSGFCTQACDRLCPDTYTVYNAFTFCVDLAHPDVLEAQTGFCVPQCDMALFPDNNGCAQGFECMTQQRFNEAEVTRQVCMPLRPDPANAPVETNPSDEEGGSEEEHESPSDPPNPHN